MPERRICAQHAHSAEKARDATLDDEKQNWPNRRALPINRTCVVVTALYQPDAFAEYLGYDQSRYLCLSATTNLHVEPVYSMFISENSRFRRQLFNKYLEIVQFRLLFGTQCSKITRISQVVRFHSMRRIFSRFCVHVYVSMETVTKEFLIRALFLPNKISKYVSQTVLRYNFAARSSTSNNVEIHVK